MENPQGYQCDATDCGIIIKADGRVELVYPVDSTGTSVPQHVMVFKKMVELVNEHILHEDEITELTDSIRSSDRTLH